MPGSTPGRSPTTAWAQGGWGVLGRACAVSQCVFVLKFCCPCRRGLCFLRFFTHIFAPGTGFGTFTRLQPPPRTVRCDPHQPTNFLTPECEVRPTNQPTSGALKNLQKSNVTTGNFRKNRGSTWSKKFCHLTRSEPKIERFFGAQIAHI